MITWLVKLARLQRVVPSVAFDGGPREPEPRAAVSVGRDPYLRHTLLWLGTAPR